MRKLLLSLAFLLWILSIRAQTLGFADSLFASGEYYRAITEYYRAIYQGENADYCHKMICRAYLNGEDYSGLLDFLDHSGLQDATGYRAYCLIRQDRADIAEMVTRKGTDRISGYWTAVAYAYHGDYQDAQLRLNNIPQNERDQSYFALSQAIDEASKQPRKSPLLAGVLGIVPGLGYAYNGAWQTAISTLLTNALLLGVATELYDKDLKFTSCGVGLAGLGFYMGSIWGSAEDALRYNKRHRVAYLDKALEPLLPGLLDLEDK